MSTSKIKIGIASWNDRSSLYPKWCNSPEDKLRVYSTEFPMVEVDTTYYAIQSPDVSSNWVKHTPDDFKFNVKAFRLFTGHQTTPASLPGGLRRNLPPNLATALSFYYDDVPSRMRDLLWKEFERMLEPLQNSGKLGVILFQFPKWFRPGPSSLTYLTELRARLPGYCIGVEFRNRWWFEGPRLDRTLNHLRRNNLFHIAVDGPQGLESSVPPVLDTSGGICTIRFHGHNRKGWELNGPNGKSERGNYLYSEEEMRKWVERVRRVEPLVDQMHLIMNTNQGVENARLMGKLLGEGLKQQVSLF